MKEMIGLLMLAMGITGAAFAQEEPPVNNTDKAFESPAKSVFTRVQVDLGKGNKMQIETCYYLDLDYAKNIDSLVRMFMHDMEAFRDSLSDELAVKRIDYKITSPERKQVRILKYKSSGNSFLVDKSEVSALKLEQDTVNMILADGNPVTKRRGDVFEWKNYCRVSFFLNRLQDLPDILASTNLNGKIATLKKGHYQWYQEKDGIWRLRTDKTIYAKRANGTAITDAGDYLNLLIDVSLQNYKNYFVPGFRLGFKMMLNNAFTRIDKSPRQYLVVFAWEPHFIFQNVQGKLQAYRNDFIDLSFGFGPKGLQAEKKSQIAQFSLGWLVNRQGDYYEKNTFRLGMGRVSVANNNVIIEPGMYFNNFFRGVTPTVRISF